MASSATRTASEGGARWAGLPAETVNGFALHAANPTVMYVAMRSGIYRSDDAGTRWTLAAGSPTNAAAVTVDPRRPSHVYVAAAEGRIVVSRDGGITWESVR